MAACIAVGAVSVQPQMLFAIFCENEVRIATTFTFAFASVIVFETVREECREVCLFLNNALFNITMIFFQMTPMTDEQRAMKVVAQTKKGWFEMLKEGASKVPEALNNGTFQYMDYVRKSNQWSKLLKAIYGTEKMYPGSLLDVEQIQGWLHFKYLLTPRAVDDYGLTQEEAEEVNASIRRKKETKLKEKSEIKKQALEGVVKKITPTKGKSRLVADEAEEAADDEEDDEEDNDVVLNSTMSTMSIGGDVEDYHKTLIATKDHELKSLNVVMKNSQKKSQKKIDDLMKVIAEYENAIEVFKSKIKSLKSRLRDAYGEELSADEE